VFCTYAHYTPQGRLFYIGKGSNELRAYQFTGRNNYWRKIVSKYGKPDVQILANWNTEEEAFSHERLLISCFRDLGHQLANLTDGGDGTSGYKQTPEHREKNRLHRLGKSATWNIGRRHTEETKKKISLSKMGSKASTKQKEIASKLFKGNKYAAGNTAQRKWVWIGTDIKTGEVIRLVGEKALKDAGIQHANVIKCINGLRRSHKGYTWTKEPWESK
jgi:hypothetical protein